MNDDETVGDVITHTTCAKPNLVTCDLKGKCATNKCPNCIDVTLETKFLLKKLKPKSGTLKMTVINLDAVPLLIHEFNAARKGSFVWEDSE